MYLENVVEFSTLLFAYNVSFSNVSYVFFKIVYWGLIYEVKGRIGTPGLCNFG